MLRTKLFKRHSLSKDAHVAAEVAVREVYQLAVLVHHLAALRGQQRDHLAVVAADGVLLLGGGGRLVGWLVGWLGGWVGE